MACDYVDIDVAADAGLGCVFRSKVKKKKFGFQ